MEFFLCLQRRVCLYAHVKLYPERVTAPVLKVTVFGSSSFCVCVRFHTDIDAVQRGAFSTGCHKSTNSCSAILHSCILYHVHISVYNFPFLFLSSFWETLCCLYIYIYIYIFFFLDVCTWSPVFVPFPAPRPSALSLCSFFVCLFFDCISLIHFCCLFCFSFCIFAIWSYRFNIKGKITSPFNHLPYGSIRVSKSERWTELV